MATQQTREPRVLTEDPVSDFDNQEENHEGVFSANVRKPSSREKNFCFPATGSSRIEPRLSLLEVLGYSGLLSVIGGSLWILGVFGFLTFLWFGYGSKPEAADAALFWRFIALRNYFTQTVTILSIALRVVVGIQATVCTSMLAALMLEKYGAQKSLTAWLSVMRSLNDGPLKLGGLLLTKRHRVTFIRVESWLTFLLITITMPLQFSSTLILGDMNDFVIVGNPNNTQFSDLFPIKDNEIPIVVDLSFAPLEHAPVYATFGETQAHFDATPNEKGISDTGLIQRSMVPIRDSNDRVSVRNLESTTAVISSRFSCIRPYINGVYSSYPVRIYEADGAFGYVEGTLDYDTTFSRAGISSNIQCGNTGCKTVGFQCTISGRGITPIAWPTTGCIIEGPTDKNSPSSYFPSWDPSQGVWSANATIMMVITTNMNRADWATTYLYECSCTAKGTTNAAGVPCHRSQHHGRPEPHGGQRATGQSCRTENLGPGDSRCFEGLS